MGAVADTLVKYGSTVSLVAAQATFSTTVRFLRWLVSNQTKLKEFVSTLRKDHSVACPEDWESIVALWQEHIQAQDNLQRLTRYSLIKNLNTFLTKLFDFGVVPRFDLLRPPKEFRTCRPTKTLAEVARDHSDRKTEGILNEALSRTGDLSLESEMKRDFLKTLIDETGAISGTPQAHAKLLMKINSDRLSAVRQAAEKDFIKWLDWWNDGQNIINDYDMEFGEIAQRIHKRKTHRFVRSLFPPDNDRLSLGRLLTYLLHHPNVRGQVTGHPNRTLNKTVTSQILRFGGVEPVQARLFPHIDLTNAVIVLVLCDTGANISVARRLPTECLDNSENRGYRVIKGTKTRAGGKLITNELPVDDALHKVSCINALQTYQEVSMSMRKLASDQDAKLLFLQLKSRGVVRGVINNNWTRWFQSFCKRHRELAHLHLQAKMIRPSVLMQAAFEKEAGVIAAAAIADHSTLKTINPYVSRYPNKVIWERMIREFQGLFQAVAIHSIKGAGRKLQLTSYQVNRLFSEACRTGLGVACLNPKGGIQPGSEKGISCTQLQNCHGCPNRFVVATVENLRDLIIWNNHLEKSRNEWELTRPEKWEKDWLPWLVFTQVIMQQASRGRTAPQFRKANVLAQAMINARKVNLPLLW